MSQCERRDSASSWRGRRSAALAVPSNKRVSQCERRDSASSWRGRRSAALAVPFNKRCRKKESNFHRAIIGRVLGLRAIPAIYWCAVRESNPHLLVVGQLFSSVELPAQKLGERTVSAVARELSRGCRSETLRSPLINGAGCRNRTCFVSLKRRVHSRICQSRALKPGKRTVSAVVRELSRVPSSPAERDCCAL